MAKAPTGTERRNTDRIVSSPGRSANGLSTTRPARNFSASSCGLTVKSKGTSPRMAHKQNVSGQHAKQTLVTRVGA